ncbi:hypothetical protein GmHk_20G057438 [Glycine max]|nr:hypothetical protein GmHk_20G057438 [Glycine max]
MPQIHHHQEDYGYNPQFFSASKEDFMSNLIGTNFQTPESAYVYMQSTPIPSFASFHQSILSVFALMYCDGDMVPSYEGIMFECPSDPKVITINKVMSLVALRKIIFDANKGCKILINLFTVNQSTYVKVVLNTIVWSSNVTMITEGPIELNAIFGHSPDETIALMRQLL